MKQLLVGLGLLALSLVSSDLYGQKKEANVPATKTGTIQIQQVNRGYLGVFTTTLQPEDSLLYPVFVSIEPGSPAHKAGLVAGDTVLSFNGVSARGGFEKVYPMLIPRNRINFRIARNGVREVVVTVGERNHATFVLRRDSSSSGDSFSFDISQIIIPILGGMISFIPHDSSGVVSFAGAEGITVNRDLSTSLNLKVDGVLILNIKQNTPAYNGGLKAGDVITRVGKMRITNVKELSTAAIKESSNKVVVQVSRNGKIESKTVQLASAKK